MRCLRLDLAVASRSGQLIEGPPRKKADPKDIAKDVFEAAKK